ncbi:hypothetical protein F4804DRAFT_309193 [Jackrogersella minutella]|nr:hypothetical protein F4804DRAFT_309193 [Jackrogersella minutella]
MSLSKQRISSPLEAGPSILDAYNLPSHLTGALEYASKRLARKSLHITLVVVRKEYQLPSVVPPTPTSSPPTPGIVSPTRFTSPVAGLRQLVRRGTSKSTTSLSSTASDRSNASTPSLPPPSTESLVSPRRWALPLTPGSPNTPMTPATPSSIMTASSTGPITQGPNEFGLRLIYTGQLPPKAEKTLRTTIQKAERKFRIGTGWLPAATTASACGLNVDLVRRSLVQNELLFSSEGLTLLGLDRMYTFKAALAAYARSINCGGSSSSSSRTADSGTQIEDAVDSLRRLVLANCGRPVSRADLYRSYDWLGVNARALKDVEEMYRRAYGGPERAGAFEMTAAEREREAARPVVKIGSPPAPKTTQKTQTTPVLKLNTRLATATTTRIFKPKARPIAAKETPHHHQQQPENVQGAGVIQVGIKLETFLAPDSDDEDEEEEHTARPAAQGLPFWTAGASIDEMMLSPCCGDRQSQRLGPSTPNGYDDISPVTRGEWGFLFTGDGWKQGKTAAVETC